MAGFADILDSALSEESTTGRSDAGTDFASVVDAGAFQAEPSASLHDFSAARSVAELRRVFRRVALETHPDRPGGSHAAFLRITRQFEQALEALLRGTAEAASFVGAYAGTKAARRPFEASTYL